MVLGSTEYLNRFELSKVGVISDSFFHLMRRLSHTITVSM